MPSANKMTPVVVDLPEVQGRYAELDSYTVGFESYPMTSTRPRSSGACPTTGARCPHGASSRPARSPSGGSTTRRRTVPATPTTPGPATGRWCRRGPAWWSSARLTASSCWRGRIWWLIPAPGSDHDVADLTWCRSLILGRLRGRRIAIVIVSLASQFWGDLSAEVKFLSVGACRRVVRAAISSPSRGCCEQG